MSLTNKANQHARNYVAAHFSLIDAKHIKAGQCRYNHHCHINSIHDAMKAEQKRIAMMVYFENCAPIVHFVNESPCGTFTDNTLGYYSSKVEMYFVRWVNEAEFDDIFNVHNSMRAQITRSIPWYIRWFIKFDC